MNRRGVWCGAGDFGRTREDAEAFVDKLVRNGFNLCVVEMKHGDGRVSWPCEMVPELATDLQREIDTAAEIERACHARGVEVHAWFFDFAEGGQGLAFERHPEWAARNAAGLPTTSETLRGHRYGAAWMCPARRPGYTDQWLVPLYAEFARRYAFDGLHHDYVRYPGDLAPDQYCFCDYCLEQVPRWAGYVNEAYPDEPFFHELYDRPYLESHWEQSPRVLPANWGRLPRDVKARFILEGAFFQAGRHDLDYFYYTYRVEQVREFTRLAAEAVRRERPGMKVSAAVFKNPVHSGRFIGQDWRRFEGFVDELMPMDYRDHYPGTFEQYLALLSESIHRQREWSRNFPALLPGIAANFLFKEEPSGPYPPEKLTKTIKTIAATGVDGMMIFCAGQLDHYGLWEAARDAW